MATPGLIRKLIYRGFSPYYYLRKYLFVAFNFGVFRARRTKYLELKKQANPAALNIVKSFERTGWSPLQFDPTRLGRVVKLCQSIERDYRLAVHGGGAASVKDFWSVIVNSQNINRHPTLLEFVRDDYFRNLATLYIGEEAVLADVSLTTSFPTNKPPNHSQLWHVDADDTKILIFYVYCSDVDDDSGPFVLASRNGVQRRLVPRFLRKHGYTDADFNRNYQPVDVRPVTGGIGTLFACDTVNTYHYGSRCKSKSRLALSFRYTSFSGLYPVSEVQTGA